MLVADATVSATDRSELGDAGLARVDERARAAASVGGDSSLAAQARGITHVESTDAAIAPDTSTALTPIAEIPGVAAADASTGSSEPSSEASAPASTTTAEKPSASAADSGVPPKSSEPIDAGVSPVKPAPSAPPAVLDAGPSKTSPPPDAGNPTNAARCVAGRYAGAFRGQISQSQLGSIALSGTVSFQLTLSADGRTLDVVSGVVDATDAAGTPIHADIDGTVDCTTNQVRGGTLRGHYGAEASDNNAFAGSADGTYEPTPSPKLHGTWTVPLPDASATGSYEATLQD